MSRRPAEVRYDGHDAMLALCTCTDNYVWVSPNDVWNGTVWCRLCDPTRPARLTGDADALQALLKGALRRTKEMNQ